MDNSPEFLNALHYAATRAAKTGGGVEVLAIITPQDQTHWLGVAEKMREEARETIEENFQIYSNWMKDELKLEAELVIREGEKACLLYTSPSPRDLWISRMPSSA